MGIFDEDLSPELRTTTAKKTTAKPSGMFDDFLTVETPSPEVKLPVFSEPSPIAPKTYKAPDYSFKPKAVEDFSAALKTGNVKVSGDSTIAQSYDAAPDKFKYKQTLSNSEIEQLKKERPDSVNAKSTVIYDATVKASDYGAPITGGTIDRTVEDKASILNPYRKLGIESLTNKYIATALAPAAEQIGKAIAWETYDPATNTTTEIPTKRRVLWGLAGVVNTIFSPISFAAQEISSDNPEDLSNPGNVIAKAAALPFEATVWVMKTSLNGYNEAYKLSTGNEGLSDEDLSDAALIISALLPLAKRAKETGTDISTIRDMANDSIKKIKDMTPEVKSMYRQWAKDLHPDATGLPSSYFVRFNEAAMRGDINTMKSVLKEWEIARANISTSSKPYESSAVMREDAVKGNENATIRNGQYQEAMKETPVLVKNKTGTDLVSVDTVKYSDGSHMIRVNVNVEPGNSISTQFEGAYTNEDAAIEAGIRQAKEIAQGSLNEQEIIDHLNEMDTKIERMQLEKEMEKQMKDEYKSEAVAQYKPIISNLTRYANRRQKSGRLEITANDISTDRDARAISDWLRNEQMSGMYEGKTEDSILNDYLDQSDYNNKPTTKKAPKMKPKAQIETEILPNVTEKTSTMQLSEGPYKGQFQVTIVEGSNKGKFAIGKTEESAMMKLEDVKVWKAVTREPTAPAKDQEVSNKNTEKKPTTEPTPEVKSKLQANKNSEKLRKVADNLREKSEESLNQNRNDNTARRARMADGARDSARADLEFANTLTKLADAMDKGEVKSLVNIGSKVDLARLESVFRRAENKAARELGKAEKDLTTAEIAKYVETNKMRAYLSRSDVEKISPSSYGKATKAGVDLKGFLKAAQGDWITISKWEKEIEYAVKNATSIGIDSYSVRNMGEELTTYRALEKIKGSSSFADIFDELKMIKEGAKVVETPAEILKRKERDLVQRTSIEGFFPTPEKTVSRMIEEAGIEKGMTVLEPSAGIGSIADQIRAAGIEPDVGEYASSLSQHLTDKGYNVVSSDFMDLPKSKKYDRIIMNPPFERLQDVDHVMKAYDHLNDGGRIVAIMGESAFFNSTKKAVEFRDWLDKVGGYEKLPEGTFKDSLRSTGVATRMVFIDKIGNSEIIEAVNKGEDLTYLSKRKPKWAIGGLNSTGGDKGIAQFEKREGEQTAEAFKLSQRVQKVIDEMETRFTKYVAPGSQGTFYTKSKNIALRSVNEVAVVQHELSHFVDNALGITDELIRPVGKTINGRNVYSSVTKPTRDQLTRIYVDTYPGARKTDALYTRVKEGYAMTQQLWLETPERLMKEYPELYKQYVQNAPELQKKLNTSMEAIVRDYQDLSARDRINAVKSRALNPTNPEKFLTIKERIEEYMVDAITRFEKLDTLAGNTGTRNSVSDLLYANQNVLMRVLKNLTEPGEGFWSFNKFGELEKVSDNNYSGMIADLGKKWKLDEFSDYLIARDQFYNWKRLDVQKAELKEMTKGFMETLENNQTLADLPKEMLEVLKEKAKEVSDFESIMKINSMILSREDVTKVATENAEFYKPYAEQFDKFNQSDLKAMEASGMISAERFAELSQLEGYAPMKRLMQDGLIGQENILPGSGKGTKAWKASSLKQRTGGTHDIIDPLISYAANHREVMLKVYKQFIMNKLYDTMVQFPNFSQEVSFRTINIDGKVARILGDGTKLEDAPNVILKMTDGKPHAIAINEWFAKPLEMIFKPTERGGLEKFVVGSARRFSQGTTGLYPLFALTNLTRDQQSALVNTQNAYNPGAFPKYAGLTASIMLKDKVSDLQYKKIIGPAMKKIADMLPNMESKDAQYVREYMALGGEYNTTLNFNEMPGEKLLEAMAKEKSGLKRFGDFLGTGLDLAAMPANISEIATRVQEYAKARESGKGQWAAMEYAGKVSAPFHHKGLVAKNAFARASINSIPYLNAALQGTAQYFKTAGRDKAGLGRASAAAIITGAVALYIVLNALENSDDKTKQAFTQLDAGSLGLYLYFPIGDGEFTKIPISQQNGWLGALMTMVVADKKYGAHYSTKEYLDAMTVGFPDQIKLFDQEKVLLSVIPQILKPSLEIIFNKKTFPSVRDLESQAQKMQLPQFRSTPNTSTFAKSFAQSDVGLKVGLSPIQIDNLLEGYLGRAVGYLTGKPTAYDPKSPFKQPEYFTSGRIIQKFYDEFGQDGKLAQTMTSIKKGDLKSTPEQDLVNYTKNKRASAVLDLLKDLKEQETNTPEFNATRKQIWEGVTKLLYEFDPSSITADEKKGFATKIEAADWKIEQSDIVDTYVKKYQDATDNFKRTRLEKELKAEIQGDSKTMTDSQKNHYEATVQKLRKAWAASEDPFVGELSGLKLNADKAKKLVEKRDEMIASGKTQEDFMAYMRDLIKKKVVSEDLMGKVNRLMKQ